MYTAHVCEKGTEDNFSIALDLLLVDFLDP